jgi:peptidoglycan/xylan/chitin deacetylase (PgdA/CDA1 family)
LQEIRWPEGKRCAVVLSFDLDAEYLWKVWLEREPTLIELSQGRYDVEVALPRVLRMLNKNNLKATFFVPGAVAERYPEAVKLIAEEGHEVAHHGYRHEDFSKLTPDQERKAIEDGSWAIHKACGRRPRGARVIPGTNTYDILSDAGFLYNSVLMDRDIPYPIRFKDSIPLMIELPVTFSFNDTAYFVYTFGLSKPLFTPSMVAEIYTKEFEAYYSEGGYCMFMLHPQVIGRPHRLTMLEQTIDYMRRKGDVWFATAEEVAAHVKRLFLPRAHSSRKSRRNSY